MTETDVLSPHATKAIEYLIAIGYLMLFVPFWRFVQGTARTAVQKAPAAEPERAHAAPSAAGWFHVPESVYLHPGHAWAVPTGLATVKVGVDDLVHRLIGPLDSIELPKAGTVIRQGEPAFTLRAGGHAFDVRSPVDGVVLAANEEALSSPDRTGADPYGSGWLVSVAPKGTKGILRGLLSGDAARRFLDAAAEALAARLPQPVGVLAQDGGTPVAGVAREIDPERWDELVRSFLLTA